MEEQESQAEALLGQTETHALHTLHAQAFSSRFCKTRLSTLWIGSAHFPPGPEIAFLPRRHQHRFYSALPGRAQAGWLQRWEEGGSAGWGME